MRPAYEPDAFGRIAERIARFIGTARFLVVQSIVVVLWIAYNIVAPASVRFDSFPFIFLTLALSLQAAYAAPLILLAQNRQDDRDRANLAQDREQTVRTREDTEYLAREIAAMRITIGELATRDFLRSELRGLLAELDAGDRPRARDRAGKGSRDRDDRSDRRSRKDKDKDGAGRARTPSAGEPPHPSPDGEHVGASSNGKPAPPG
ncbi:DUF1003 domain-containing protein [Frankia sp. AiPa1]|uniref:DUF1003 domain-containing protein n=1 Tax=Frankia sp. AiPa1 TaxID=573492 RepID=UPI00202B2512|nr:DUF1003 domain-containing protein [Frankia sp. AiPa1]MCL9758365.1 DUF1003 domain-containing protein [Frankia sp. AiPa1]